MPNRFEGLGGGAESVRSVGKQARASWSAWRCASLASLALAGCVVANVAGCGGGGGGSTIVPTPQLATATILLLNSDNIGVNGTVTLNGVTKTTTNSRAVFPNLQPRTYDLTFTVGSQTTRTTIVVVGQSPQTYVAIPGISDVSSSGITLLGRTLLNTPASSAVSACTTSSEPVTAPLVIQVRSLNTPGNPIVSSVIRAANRDGRYSIRTLPSPGTYRVEARNLDSSTAPFAGASASFTVSAGQTQANLDICTNQSTSQPGGTPPPPPGTPTPGPGTPTAAPTTTGTPGTPSPTQTPGGPTATPGVPTETPQATATNTTAPTATNTPGEGTPTAAPTATNTPIGGGGGGAEPPGVP